MSVAAIEAARQVPDPTRTIKGYELRDIIIGNAIIIPHDRSIETMITMKPWRQGSKASTAQWTEFNIHSRSAEEWHHNCSGLIQVRYSEEKNTKFVDEEAKEIETYVRKLAQIKRFLYEAPKGSAALRTPQNCRDKVRTPFPKHRLGGER